MYHTQIKINYFFSDRERETDRQTDRDTERDTHTERHRQRDTQRDRDRERQRQRPYTTAYSYGHDVTRYTSCLRSQTREHYLDYEESDYNMHAKLRKDQEEGGGGRAGPSQLDGLIVLLPSCSSTAAFRTLSL